MTPELHMEESEEDFLCVSSCLPPRLMCQAQGNTDLANCVFKLHWEFYSQDNAVECSNGDIVPQAVARVLPESDGYVLGNMPYCAWTRPELVWYLCIQPILAWFWYIGAAFYIVTIKSLI